MINIFTDMFSQLWPPIIVLVYLYSFVASRVYVFKLNICHLRRVVSKPIWNIGRLWTDCRKKTFRVLRLQQHQQLQSTESWQNCTQTYSIINIIIKWRSSQSINDERWRLSRCRHWVMSATTFRRPTITSSVTSYRAQRWRRHSTHLSRLRRRSQTDDDRAFIPTSAQTATSSQTAETRRQDNDEDAKRRRASPW